MNKLVIFGAIAVAMLSMCGCKSKGVVGEAPDTRKVAFPINRELSRKVTDKNNAFAFKMAGALGIGESNKNELISPTSLTLSMSMLYNGMSGESAQALAKVLQVNGISIEDLNLANADTMKRLSNSPGAEIGLANGIWVRNTTLIPSYVDQMKKSYDAEIAPLSSNDGEAIKTINEWVGTKTKQRITNLIEHISDDTIMCLVSAVSFDGQWAKSFDPSETRNQVFHAQSRDLDVEMMSRHDKTFAYGEFDGAQVVDLLYEQNAYRMLVALPKKGRSVKGLLSHEKWAELIKGMQHAEGTVKIPKFAFDAGYDLREGLTKLGAGQLFQKSVDFGKMTLPTKTHFIPQVVHKTHIEVDEKGTRAAAATHIAVADSAKATLPPKPFEFTADRPFVIAIVESSTNQILFLGVVNEPNSAGAKKP